MEVGVQYVYDEKGRRTGVIIPTELWNDVKGKIEVNLEEEVRSLR